MCPRHVSTTVGDPPAAPLRRGAAGRAGLTFRVLVASVVLAVIVGGTFAVLLDAISADRQAAGLALQSQMVLTSANRLQRLVIDLETGARGYLLTGEESSLQPWTAARQAVPQETANLQHLTTDPGQHQRAVQITQAIDSYIDGYSVPLISAARRGDPAARSVATTTEGQRRVDELRTFFDGLETTEYQLATTRDASSAAKAEQAVIVAACGLGISVGLILLLAGYLTRSIVRPVLRVARMANRLADGELSSRTPETGVGEMRTLERSFNQMGAALERNRDQLAALLAEQAALRRMATLVARGESPAAVFAAVVEEVGKVLDVDGAVMLRKEADGSGALMAGWGGSAELPVAETVSGEDLTGTVTQQVFSTGRIAWQDTFEETEGWIRSWIEERGPRLAVGAPITVEGRVWGAMVIVSLRPLRPEQVDQRLAQFTELVATAIANAQAREDLAASRARLVAASDQTRRRIERDLHDGIQQRLVNLALDLRRAEADVPPERPELRDQLSDMAGEVTAALEDLREIGRGIHPTILSRGGLELAVKALTRRSTVPVEFDVRIATRPPPLIEIAAYYLVAEALTNAGKHAEASRVRIEARIRDDRLEIAVTDDGVGGADPAGGTSLVGLIDRISALGGRITITSPRGAGTKVRVELPMDDGPAASVVPG
jgi:signal transduction histidine kinase/CHASE3 domain sensor protein